MSTSGAAAPPAAATPPRSVTLAAQLIYGLIGLSLLNLILTITMRDSLIESWAENAGAGNRQLLERGGVDAVADNAPAFVPIAVIGFVLFGLLFVLLGLKLVQGASWARVVLTVLSLLALLGTPLSFIQSRPAVFTVLVLVQAVVYIALLVLLWQKETSAHVASTP